LKFSKKGFEKLVAQKKRWLSSSFSLVRRIEYLLNSGVRATGHISSEGEWVNIILSYRRHTKDSILFFETLLRKRLGVCKDIANVIGRMMW
jgi:hypothetical protein